MADLEVVEMECAIMLSSILETERMKKGMSQVELCEALGISLAGYKKIRSGKLNVRFITIVRALHFFGIKMKFVTEKGSWMPATPPTNVLMKDMRKPINRIKMKK